MRALSVVTNTYFAGLPVQQRGFFRGVMAAGLFLLLATIVFDPADSVFHAKIPAFLLCWLILIIDFVATGGFSWSLSYEIIIYLLLFSVMLPLISIEGYFASGGILPSSESLQYLKSYLFLTIAIPLVIGRIKIVRLFSFILTGLSVLTITIYFVTLNNDFLLGGLQFIGDKYGIMAITERSYGTFAYRPIYFHTSPLLVFPIAYFAREFSYARGFAKVFAALGLMVNVCGMFLSGTRSNILISVLLPVVIFWWYSSRKLVFALVLLGLGSAVTAANLSSLGDALSLHDESNSVKYLHFLDYSQILQNPKTILVGDGVGSRFFAHGFGKKTSVTELTYLELLREYGLFLGVFVGGLLFLPLLGLVRRLQRNAHYVYLAYLAYLIICILNPLLLSSSGMVVLAIVVSLFFESGTLPVIAPAGLTDGAHFTIS